MARISKAAIRIKPSTRKKLGKFMYTLASGISLDTYDQKITYLLRFHENKLQEKLID